MFLYSSDQNTWVLARLVIYSFAREVDFKGQQALNKNYQNSLKCHFFFPTLRKVPLCCGLEGGEHCLRCKGDAKVLCA